MRAIIAGAGPAGLVSAWLLAERGYEVVLLEKRSVIGGKVSSWRDADGDWVESGLHVFFGAYKHLLSFLHLCGLSNTFQWRPAEIILTSPVRDPGSIRFMPSLPVPFHGIAGVLNNRSLPLREKLRMVPGILQCFQGGQAYIDAQEGESYASWHLRHGMGEAALREMMDAMALSLNFQTTEHVSARLILTAMLRFMTEHGAAKMAFVKGAPTVHIWNPVVERLRARGAIVDTNQRVAHILYDATRERVDGFKLEDGSLVQGDVYISAMPFHNLRKVLPDTLRAMPEFEKLRHLKGQPVITVQLFFDRQVTAINHVLFGTHTRLPVYADMSNVAPDYHRPGASTIQLVVAPAADLITLDDEALIARVMSDFVRLHPIAAQAKLLKYTIVRIPNSVYQARPGVEHYRPDQRTPVDNFFLAGDYTRQELLASIEGAVISAERCVGYIDAWAREQFAQRLHLELTRSLEAPASLSSWNEQIA